MTEEEYRKIEGYKNYSVSNYGNIRNDNTERIIKSRKHNGYILIKLSKGNQPTSFGVHRLVAKAFIPNPSNKLFIDHIDNNPFNNNVSNLRWSTRRENLCNKRVQKNNSSGFKGVSFHKKSNRWRARIRTNGQEIYIGQFETIEDAVIARYKKALEIQKEFMNKVEIEQYNIAIKSKTAGLAKRET